jgi:uncharacterized protein (TIGR03437 family)
VAVSGLANSGTVIASIAAGRATDAAGNPNTASTSTDNAVAYSRLSGPNVPQVGWKGIVNGASFSQDAIISPNSIVSLFGTDLAATTAFAALSLQNASATNPGLGLPTTLGGTQVLVNSVPAPLFYVSPTQINFQMPPNVIGGAAEVVVVSAGIAGPPALVEVTPAAPGVFTTNQQGTGQGAILHTNYSPNSTQNPAQRGSVVAIYCTGLGAVNPAVPQGKVPATAPLSVTVQTPNVLVGGVPAEVLYSGLAPGFVGLYQVNVRIPNTVVAGTSIPVEIQIGGRSSNVVTVAVRP